jgi:hypothetical protein
VVRNSMGRNLENRRIGIGNWKIGIVEKAK